VINDSDVPICWRIGHFWIKVEHNVWRIRYKCSRCGQIKKRSKKV